MSTETIASMYQHHLEKLVKEAERDGVSVRVTREPLQPLAMGHAGHVVEAWPARHQPAETGQQP